MYVYRTYTTTPRDLTLEEFVGGELLDYAKERSSGNYMVFRVELQAVGFNAVQPNILPISFRMLSNTAPDGLMKRMEGVFYVGADDPTAGGFKRDDQWFLTPPFKKKSSESGDRIFIEFDPVMASVSVKISLVC